MLEVTPGASLLGNLLSRQGFISSDDGVIRAGKWMKEKRFIMLSNCLTKLKIQRYFQNKAKFKVVYS